MPFCGCQPNLRKAKPPCREGPQLSRRWNRDLLVDPAWLRDHLNDPSVRVVDCTAEIVPRPVGPSLYESRRREWLSEHIPGAVYLHLDEDLSDPHGPFPFALPKPDAVWRTLSGLGFEVGATIVLYGGGIPWAVHRVWWVLMASGVRDVRVLDGGRQRWVAEGHPTESGPVSFAATEFLGRPRPEMVATKREVFDCLDDGKTCLLNSLPDDQLGAAGGPRYGRAGQIPGSVNVSAMSLIDPVSHRFLEPAALQAQFDRAGVPDNDRIITYCGGGLAASTTFLALSVLGYQELSLYDGSLLEWAKDPDMPMTAA